MTTLLPPATYRFARLLPPFFGTAVSGTAVSRAVVLGAALLLSLAVPAAANSSASGPSASGPALVLEPVVSDSLPSPPSDTADVEWTTSLPPLTVTATRLPTPAAEAPSRVDVLDSTAIAATGATSVAELLEERAGMFVRQYGSGGLASMSLRGTGASQTAVLLDGHRIGDPQVGQLDVSLLPTVLLSSVEVMHGPASPLHGSDGIGGAVHLRSVQPQAPLSVRVRGTAGAFGARGTSVLVGSADRDSETSVVAAAEYRQTDGDFPYFNESLYPPRTVRRRNADRRRLSAYGAVRSRLGSHRLRVAGWLVDAERGLPGVSGRAGDAQRQWDTQLRLWGDDTVQRSWGTLSLGGLVQRTQIRYLNAGQSVDATGHNWLSSMEATARIPLPSHWMVTGGVSGSSAWARHPQLDADAREQQAAAFASAVATYGRVRLYPAARTDVYWTPGAGTRVALSPRLGANVQVGDGPLHWKLQAGRAFRTPTLNDRYWQPGGNPDLRPEHGWSVDTGLSWDGRRGQAEVTGFANWRTDQIVWRRVEAGYWSPANLEQVRALGVEASAERTWPLALAAAARTGLTYTFTDARDRSTPGSPSYNQPLRFVPRHQIKAHGTLSWGPAALDVHARYTGPRPVTATGSQHLAGYALVDLQLRLATRVQGVQTELSAGVDNVLDADYRVVGNRPMPPRHLQLRLALSF